MGTLKEAKTYRGGRGGCRCDPFFVGAAGEREIFEGLPGGTAVGREPVGFLACGEECFERLRS